VLNLFKSETFIYLPPFSLGKVETSLAVSCEVAGHFVMCFFYHSLHKMASA
jgi:hypothetical protein